MVKILPFLTFSLNLISWLGHSLLEYSEVTLSDWGEL